MQSQNTCKIIETKIFHNFMPALCATWLYSKGSKFNQFTCLAARTSNPVSLLMVSLIFGTRCFVGVCACACAVLVNATHSLIIWCEFHWLACYVAVLLVYCSCYCHRL